MGGLGSVLVLVQSAVLCLMIFFLKIDIESKKPITNESIFQIIVVYSIALRVSYNTLRALNLYAGRVFEIYSCREIPESSALTEKKGDD